MNCLNLEKAQLISIRISWAHGRTRGQSLTECMTVVQSQAPHLAKTLKSDRSDYIWVVSPAPAETKETNPKAPLEENNSN